MTGINWLTATLVVLVVLQTVGKCNGGPKSKYITFSLHTTVTDN